MISRTDSRCPTVAAGIAPARATAAFNGQRVMRSGLPGEPPRGSDMQQSKTLKEVADYLGGTVKGDETVRVGGLAPLETAGPDAVTFLANPKYAAKGCADKGRSGADGARRRKLTAAT